MAFARKGWSRIQLTDGKILSIRRYHSCFRIPYVLWNQQHIFRKELSLSWERDQNNSMNLIVLYGISLAVRMDSSTPLT